jgi:hypothetical protein
MSCTSNTTSLGSPVVQNLAQRVRAAQRNKTRRSLHNSAPSHQNELHSPCLAPRRAVPHRRHGHRSAHRAVGRCANLGGRGVYLAKLNWHQDPTAVCQQEVTAGTWKDKQRKQQRRPRHLMEKQRLPLMG